MATTSRMAAFRAALFDALKASPALAGVQVAFGEPDTVHRESIRMTDTVTGEVDEFRLQAGRRRRTETCTHEVVIEVTNKTTVQASEARAVELLAAVEDVLVADPISNPTWGDGVWSVKPTEVEMTTSQAQTPWTRITLTIETSSRLT